MRILFRLDKKLNILLLHEDVTLEPCGSIFYYLENVFDNNKKCFTDTFRSLHVYSHFVMDENKEKLRG